MTVEGITFDLMRVTPMDDALIYDAMIGDKNKVLKYSDNMALSTTGLNVYIAKGAAVIEGRLIRISDQEALAIPANGSGYICITIDLTKVNSFTGTPGSTNYVPINNQVRIEALKTLVQQDLHSTGKIYTYPLASYTSTAGAVTLVPMNTTGDYDKRITGIIFPDRSGISGTVQLGCTLVGSPEKFVQESTWAICKEAGTYMFDILGSISGASSGTRNIALTPYRNGVAVGPMFTVRTQAVSNGTMAAKGMYALQVGDKIMIETSGSSTGSLQQVGGFITQV